MSARPEKNHRNTRGVLSCAEARRMYHARMLVVLVLGAVASALSFALAFPPAREARIKLGTLIDQAERENPQFFRQHLAPINPFAGGRFDHRRVTGILKADFTHYGEISQRLHRELKKLDRRAHVGMIPFGLYLVGAGLWWWLK